MYNPITINLLILNFQVCHTWMTGLLRRVYFGRVYFDKVYFDKVYFDKVYFDKVYFDKVYFDKVYFDGVLQWPTSTTYYLKVRKIFKSQKQQNIIWSVFL